MPKRSEPRLTLTRERILHAALDLADESDVESITMRKLAHELGFEAMSLYYYVSSKDDVLDGILDLVLGECELPSAAGDWDEAIRSSAISVNQALRRHAWAGALVMAPGRLRPARLHYMDSLLGRLRDAGFPAGTTYHAYHVLDGHIFGFSLWQTSHTYTAAEYSDMAAMFARAIPVDEYPYLHEHGEQHFAGDHLDEVSAFELGLDFILEGLRATRDRAWEFPTAKPPDSRDKRRARASRDA
jgi:AcrR family transcriptional regulator